MYEVSAGHGPAIGEDLALQTIEGYISHRKQRGNQILKVLQTEKAKGYQKIIMIVIVMIMGG